MIKIKYLLFTLSLCLITFTTIDAKEFDCKIGNYTITYNETGKIVSVKDINNKKIEKRFESYFKPKSKSECPTGTNAKVSIIDGDRTLYVAKIDETFGRDETTSESKSCYEYKDQTSCEESKKTACIWVENEEASGNQGGYCNVDNLLYVGCGDASDIPMQVPEWISFLINLLKIATPIVLIFTSVLSLFKALASSKEDEIKKAQSSLIKKIIAAVMVFFVIAIVQFVISKVAEDDEYQGFTDCMNCFINNKCSQGSYYRTVVSGEDHCTPLTTGKTVKCDTLFK